MRPSGIRHRDAQRVRELVLPKPDEVPRSLIIQGLPGCGVEQVFTDLGNWLRTEWAQPGFRILVEKNLSTFWVKPVVHLVRSIHEDASGSSHRTVLAETEPKAGDLETELVRLRESILHHAQGDGQLIFALDNFDALLKFPDPDQVQGLLNILQSLGYEHRYRTAFIICCCRDIEDICQTVNYSDFHKIFGTNHHRVSRVSDQDIERSARLSSPELDSQQIETIVALSAGYPEHADLLLRYTGPKEEIRRQAVDALTLSFEEWVSCLTADEQQVLQLISRGQTIGYEHLFAQKKLLRRGILTEIDGDIKIASPLFQDHLMARVGKIHGDQTPCVRKAGLLASNVHCTLLEQLFQGRYYLDWQLLQSPRTSDATVYLVSGEDERGVSYRPCIVKVHRSDMMDRELAATGNAMELLGPVVPRVLAQASLKGQKAVVFEYATGDNRSYEVRQFAEFYRTQPSEQVVSLLSKLFGQVLWPFYQTQMFKHRSASRLYFLPRLDQGEFDRLAEVARRSHFYDPDRDKIVLPNQQEPLANPATLLRPASEDPTCAYHRLFLEKRNAGLCLVHGDINPRNFLVDGIGNVHIIDFAAMKEEGGRFLDFARLETEIKFKLTDVGPTREEILSLTSVERMLTEASNDTALTMVLNLPFTDKVAKMVAAVAALRQTARSICQEKIEDIDFELEYKTALLAQTLRTSLYEGYLDQPQQEFAVVSAALITQHLLKLI